MQGLCSSLSPPAPPPPPWGCQNQRVERGEREGTGIMRIDIQFPLPRHTAPAQNWQEILTVLSKVTICWNATSPMGEGTQSLRVAIIVKRAWNNADESSCSKNAHPHTGHFLSNWTMNIPSTLAANIARFSDATSPTKSKQRAKNAPFCSPIPMLVIQPHIHCIHTT